MNYGSYLFMRNHVDIDHTDTKNNCRQSMEGKRQTESNNL